MSPEAQEIWTKLWPEALSGCAIGTKIAGLSRVLPIIVKLVCMLLQDLSWDKRKQAIAVISDLAISLDSKLLSPCMGEVIESLLRSIPGQIWNGQANALESLSIVVNKCYHTGNVDLTASKNNLLCQRTSISEIEENKSSDQHVRNNFSNEVIFTLEDAIKKKSIQLDDESTILNTTAIAMRLEISAASASSSTSSSSSNMQSTCSITTVNEKVTTSKMWIISLHDLVTLFLNETSRGDKDYRLSAARALSSLPWASITLSREGQELFSTFVGEFARLGGIIISSKEEVENEELHNQDIDTHLQSKEIKEIEDVKGDRRRKQQTNTAMFGSRYGIEFKEAKTSTSSLSRRNIPISVAAHSADQAVRQVEQSLQDRVDIGGQMGVTTAADIDVDVDAMDQDRGTNDTAAVASIAAEVNSQSPPPSSMHSVLPHRGNGSATLTSDPAFRVKLLDCISNGWPVDSLSFSDLIAQHNNKIFDTDSLIHWAINIMESGEVWSVRVAALQILGAVLSVKQREEEKIDETHPRGESKDTIMFLSAVRAITIAMADKKYSKIRTAALNCLNKLLNALHCSHCLVDREEVRIVLRLAASDPEPTVLEVASKAQKSWLTLNVSKGSIIHI